MQIVGGGHYVTSVLPQNGHRPAHCLTHLVRGTLGQRELETEAAVEAAKLRFRPIIMTSIAFILGCLPLAFSTGAGAASRVSIGVSVVCGMIAATVLAPLLVPYFFVFVMRISERVTGAARREEKS